MVFHSFYLARAFLLLPFLNDHSSPAVTPSYYFFGVGAWRSRVNVERRLWNIHVGSNGNGFGCSRVHFRWRAEPQRPDTGLHGWCSVVGSSLSLSLSLFLGLPASRWRAGSNCLTAGRSLGSAIHRIAVGRISAAAALSCAAAAAASASAIRFLLVDLCSVPLQYGVDCLYPKVVLTGFFLCLNPILPGLRRRRSHFTSFVSMFSSPKVEPRLLGFFSCWSRFCSVSSLGVPFPDQGVGTWSGLNN